MLGDYWCPTVFLDTALCMSHIDRLVHTPHKWHEVEIMLLRVLSVLFSRVILVGIMVLACMNMVIFFIGDGLDRSFRNQLNQIIKYKQAFIESSLLDPGDDTCVPPSPELAWRFLHDSVRNRVQSRFPTFPLESLKFSAPFTDDPKTRRVAQRGDHCRVAIVFLSWLHLRKR